MIENKKYLLWSLAISTIVIIGNLPFPDARPLVETILRHLNIPYQSAYGLQYLGITSVFLLVISLFFLSNSLKKYRGRFVVLGFIVMMVAPVFLVSVFQQTVATGIYAVSYDQQGSNCQFRMVGSSTLLGTCNLSFVNHSRKPVTFNVEFYERYQFEDAPKMMTLMNVDGLHEVTLSGKERRVVILEKEIDVSTVENHISGGTANGVHIIMKSDKRRREL